MKAKKNTVITSNKLDSEKTWVVSNTNRHTIVVKDASNVSDKHLLHHGDYKLAGKLINTTS